jgi:hypothetical protein
VPAIDQARPVELEERHEKVGFPEMPPHCSKSPQVNVLIKPFPLRVAKPNLAPINECIGGLGTASRSIGG